MSVRITVPGTPIINPQLGTITNAGLMYHQSQAANWTKWKKLMDDTIAANAGTVAFGQNQDTFGLPLMTDANKWRGGVYAPDGKIYFIPYVAPDILILDVRTKRAVRSAMGVDLSGGVGKFIGGALGVDGCIYAPPYNGGNILKIDPVAGVATRSLMGASAMSSNAYAGAVAAHNGKIYCPPWDEGAVLIINPTAGTATKSTMGASWPGLSGKFSGGALGPDGKIYCAPVNSPDVLVIDPVTDTAIRTTFGGVVAGTYNGAVTASNGKIYCLPSFSNTKVMEIDPVGATATLITVTGAAGKCEGGALGPDGKIYSTGGGATDWLVVDPLAGTAVRSVLGEAPIPCVGVGNTSGCVAAGRAIYGVSFGNQSIWTITGFKKAFPWHLVRSNFLNKY